jgi:predicted ATP-grasp superfamily ATP-dependent carboligase
VVLICHYGRSGYNVLRSLRAVGAKVFVIRDARAASMRYSLRSKAIHAVPHLHDAEPEIIAGVINDLHCRCGVDSVIGADVESQTLILRMRDRLTCPIFPISDAETLRILNNKWTFYQLCVRHEVQVPKTLLCEDGLLVDPDLIGRELGWPVVVKPAVGYGQRGILILQNRDDFVRRFIEARSGCDQSLIIQEYLEGPDWALGVFAREGKVEHWAAWVCPGQLDIGYGIGRFTSTEFLDRRDLADMGERLIAVTAFSGIANFDLRLDTRTGTIRMLECNPRCFNRMLATRANGVDFVRPGLPGYAGTQPRSLGRASFHPWQELFTLRGIKRFLNGHWPLGPLARDLRDMLDDPLVPIMRNIYKEDSHA